MLDVGLWIRTNAHEAEEIFLIRKDPEGHPVFSVIQSHDTRDDRHVQKAKIRDLYEQLTGHIHPHLHATSRQLMWDFLEAAMKQLP